MKNPEASAVKREEEEDWGKRGEDDHDEDPLCFPRRYVEVFANTEALVERLSPLPPAQSIRNASIP
jgi:hypothetical protein